MMSKKTIVWLAVIVTAGVLIHYLSSILAPFVIGAVIAYLVDPLVEKLDRRGVSRSVAAGGVVGSFFLLIGMIGLGVGPLIWHQITNLIQRIPDMKMALNTRTSELMPYLKQYMSDDQIAQLKETLAAHGSAAFEKAGAIASHMITGSLGAIHLFALLALTPIVAYYMVKDWPKLIEWVHLHLPRSVKPAFDHITTKIDGKLSAYFRGQGMVCACLAVGYGVGLWLVGLDFGLIVGMLTGIFAFIPYVAMIGGVSVALILAFLQFHDVYHLAIVGAVFAVVHVVESGVLVPKLIGESIGIHPVMVIFAVLAGATLFGFVGVFVAVPAAAAISVVTAYTLDQYLNSDLYS
jgi:predicted PurR-regulated permease PerM